MSRNYSFTLLKMNTKYGVMFGTYDQIQEDIKHQDKIANEQKDLTNPYNKDLVIKATEYVNNYQMYNTLRPILREQDYKKLIELWDSPDCKDFNEFITKCEVCTDWYKQDEHGNCYGGFWKYPENSYENVL